MSSNVHLRNMVSQGTVRGPPLWNIFLESSRYCVNGCAFQEVVFADDMNCYHEYPDFKNHDAIFQDLHSCQNALHEWGLHHQVIFEKTKESLHILCRKQPKGDPFKILGIHFDTKLVMYDAVVIVAAESGARLKMLLRARPFYC